MGWFLYIVSSRNFLLPVPIRFQRVSKRLSNSSYGPGILLFWIIKSCIYDSLKKHVSWHNALCLSVPRALSVLFYLEMLLYQGSRVIWLAEQDTMMVLTFSAYWVGSMVPGWRLIFSARIAGYAFVDWSSRASENFFRVTGSLSLDEWNWVREGSSGSVAVALRVWVPVCDIRERWRTVGLWSVGGPGCDLRVREGRDIT